MYLDISYTKSKVLYCILYNIQLSTVQDNREEKDGYGALNGNLTLLVYSPMDDVGLYDDDDVHQKVFIPKGQVL